MPPRLRYPECAPEGIASLRATEHYLNTSTALPAVLLELVRLRVSLRNGCNFCIGHHSNELRKHNEPETRIKAVSALESSDAFTPKEQAALAWADSVTEIQTRHAADADYATVSAFFHEKDLVDLTLAIVSINAWNRMSIAFRAEWDPARASKPLIKRENTAPVPSSASGVGLSTAVATSPNTTVQPPSSPTPANGNEPLQDTVDDDGGKVAQN